MQSKITSRHYLQRATDIILDRHPEINVEMRAELMREALDPEINSTIALEIRGRYDTLIIMDRACRDADRICMEAGY